MSLELSKKAAAVKPSSTLAITAKAKELKAQGKDVVGFGSDRLYCRYFSLYGCGMRSKNKSLIISGV